MKKRRKLKAVFVGADGSEGFVSRKEYDIVIYPGNDGGIELNAESDASTNIVVYESVYAFLKNWDMIRAR